MENIFIQNKNNNTVIDDVSDDNENEEANCYNNANACKDNSTNISRQEQEEELSCAEEDVINQCDINHDMQLERSDDEVKEVHLHPLIAEYVQQRSGNYFRTDALVNGGVHTINDHVASVDAVTRALLRKRQGELNRLASLISSGNVCDPNLQELLTLYNIQQSVDRNLPSADDGIVENVENKETYSITNNDNNYYNNNNNTIKMLTWHAPNSVDSNFTKTESNECEEEPEEKLINYSTNSINSSNNDIGLYKRARCFAEQEPQYGEDKTNHVYCTRTSLTDDENKNNNNNTMNESIIKSNTNEVCNAQNNFHYNVIDREYMMPVKRSRHDETYTSNNNTNNIDNNTNTIEPSTLRDNVSSATMPFATARENSNNNTLNQRCNGASIKGKHLKRYREVDNDDDNDESEKSNFTER